MAVPEMCEMDVLFVDGPKAGKEYRLHFPEEELWTRCGSEDENQHLYRAGDKDDNNVLRYHYVRSEPVPPVPELTQEQKDRMDAYEREQQKKDDQTLTVKKLRKILAEFPMDAKVYVEGCDCTGRAGGAEHFKYTSRRKGVLITRVEGD